MLTSETEKRGMGKLALPAICMVGMLLGSASAFAQTAGELQPQAQVQASPFTFHDLQSGRNPATQFGGKAPAEAETDPIKRLEYAAEGGSEVAMWKLGHIYASQPNDKENQLRAFEMFSRVVSSQADNAPYSAKAPFVASAFVSLGSYYLNGIPDTRIKKNTENAWRMFFTAATYYGDPSAQFALFEMCDAGAVEACSDIQAGRWLKKSAVNGHVGAQAQFGYRQFEGENGMRRNKIEGLKWLTIARARANPAGQQWIYDLHERAFSVASVEERQEAHLRADLWMKDHCGGAAAC